MSWWTFGLGKRPSVPREALSAAYERALTSAATPVASPQSTLLRTTETWQDEVWRYYDTLGEFNYSITWLSAMQSRVRLFAAELVPGQDEPVRVEGGRAVEIMDTLAGGVSGQTQIMASLAVQLAVPGEGYLVGEMRDGAEKWTVRSIDEVRARHGRYEVKDETAVNGDSWRPLVDGVVVRIHRPHKRWYHQADSSARSARSTMRELELVNRHILAQYLSRLASAGVVLFPDEVMFPVREEFAEANDPFMAEWIELAATAIREPGTASAVIPIPVRVPGEWVDKVKHLDFTLKIDEKIIEKRDSAIKRLATQVNIPAEVLLGMGEVNHWGQWAIEEGALKTTIAPDAELIANAITTGYLQPRLAASGEEDVSRFVVWYDMSELAMRPDKSDDAVRLYDRLELSGEALRREAGFAEADKPTDDDLKDQGLKVIIKTLPSGAASALSQLIGEDLAPVIPVSAQAPGVAEAAQEDLPASTENGPPSGGEAPGPDDGTAAAALRTDRLIRQAQAPHAVRFALADRWELLHPEACDGHTYSCPYMQAALKLKRTAHPGTAGLYECTLNAFGHLRVGGMTPHRDVRDYRVTRSVR
jgi:hypothetical protein